MARNLALKLFSLVLLVYCRDVSAIEYHPNRYSLSLLGSYEVMSPTLLNEKISSEHAGVLPFEGLIGFRLRLERGFHAPHWTHWMEFGYHFNTVDSDSEAGVNVVQKFSSLSVIPLGATYWFGLTSYMDFGVSLGVGMGLSNSFQYQTPSSTILYEKGFNILVDTRVQSRLWISNHFAADLMLSFRYNSPTLEGSSDTLSANLTSVGGIFGLTYAFGGAVGWGRKYVEVIPPGQRTLRPKPKKTR